ncbi:hypothetical protein K488DRAFT_41943 [Vararia minispora EC-137]|uniref:Uncharacterized protein n=1 Tax=Vararia minispora EC-137 TaxID=1314806 RepID=A0ACB8QVZ9_9AGAM|nr:hypothetical protein K488DRAFT_41943 [Vararia minispora EC-137]
MMSEFPLDVAQIVALFLESLFYGLNLVSFLSCMHALLFIKHDGSNGQYIYFMGTTLFFFTFATLDVVFLLRHVLDAFIWYKGGGHALEELLILSCWVSAMKTFTYAAQTSVADAVLVYRCLTFYKSHKYRWMIVAILGSLWAGGMVVEGLMCWIVFTYPAESAATVHTGTLSPFVTAMLVVTLILNVGATALITYHVWPATRRINEASATNGNGHIQRAMRIWIDSAAMYTLSVLVFAVVYSCNNNALYGVSDCVVQVIVCLFLILGPLSRLDYQHLRAFRSI